MPAANSSHSPGGLLDYCFSQAGVLLLPIEHLSHSGLSSQLRGEILRREAWGKAALELFEQAYDQYWQRARELNARAPRYWHPPRVQHVCIVTRPKDIRPFFQPFNRNSWLLYASDFEQATSSLELATFLFFHAERLSLVQQILPAQYLSLSYFLTLSESQLTDFRAGCRRCQRPDAGAFRALGKAMEWVSRLSHETLAPTRIAIPGARLLPDSGLIVDGASQRQLAALQQSSANAVNGVIKRYQQRYLSSPAAGGEAIAEWLMEAQARLVVTGAGGAVLWDPDRPDQTDELKAALQSLNRKAADSVLADLKVVDNCSREFLGRVRFPEELVDPAPHMSEGGLSYIHRQRKLVAYPIGGPGNEHRLWEPAPPFERLMLAARTVHEWGHLAAESGWVRVPEARRLERDRLREEIAALFDNIHERAPAGVRRQVADEVAALIRRAGGLGQGLMRALQVRVEDYMSNLLARRLLSADAMDTYVRNNVCAHVQDYSTGGAFMLLARGAYEFQYLRLSRIPDPLDWFLSSTWFDEMLFHPGVLSRADFELLVDRMGQLCDCFEIDESKFEFANNLAGGPDNEWRMQT